MSDALRSSADIATASGGDRLMATALKGFGQTEDPINGFSSIVVYSGYCDPAH
ncbi:MAG: hypothetical protein KDB79_04260 [Acidobacteria bacterium]|nr:hypothetical protein [Acidobacteriota bacterium]